MRSILAAFGLLAAVDYIPDSEFDMTKHVVTEGRDAVVVIFNTAEKQFKQLTPR